MAAPFTRRKCMKWKVKKEQILIVPKRIFKEGEIVDDAFIDIKGKEYRLEPVEKKQIINPPVDKMIRSSKNK